MSFVKAVVPLGLLLGLAIIAPTGAQAAAYCGYGAPPAADDEIVLPSRVDIAIRRTERSICKAEEHIDEGEYTQAATSLRSVRRRWQEPHRRSD